MRNPVSDSFGSLHRLSLHNSIISMCLEDLLMRKVPTDNLGQFHIRSSNGINPNVQRTNTLNQANLPEKPYSNPDMQNEILAQQELEGIISRTKCVNNDKISRQSKSVKLEATTHLPREEVRITEHDVLLGRGSGVTRHEGNKKYRSLIVRSQYDYVLATRSEKTAMARRIVADIRKHNGRFLKQDDSGTWFDVGNKKAVEKTSQALREGFAHKMRQNLLEKGFDL